MLFARETFFALSTHRSELVENLNWNNGYYKRLLTLGTTAPNELSFSEHSAGVRISNLKESAGERRQSLFAGFFVFFKR